MLRENSLNTERPTHLRPDEVAAEAFNRFAGRLIALARTKLDSRARQKLDPEDIVQSVYRSFVRRQAAGEFSLVSWDSLWGLLTRITVWKCHDKVKHFRAQSRDVRREVAASQLSLGPENQGLFDRNPTPAESAMLTEAVEQLMRRLDDPGRQMLTLALQGYSAQEIGLQVGRGERTVQRLLARVRKWLGKKSVAEEPKSS